MDADIEARLTTLEAKLDRVYASAEKTRKYIYWSIVATIVITVLVVIAPLIALMFVLPGFVSSYTSSLGDQQNLNVQNVLKDLNGLQGI